MLLKDAAPATAERLDTHRALISTLARVSDISVTNADAPSGSAQAVLDEATVILPLKDVIDLDKERARLGREIDKLDGEIAKIDKKLANEQFIAKAPAEVVAEQRDRRTEAESSRTRLAEALSRLVGG